MASSKTIEFKLVGTNTKNNKRGEKMYKVTVKSK